MKKNNAKNHWLGIISIVVVALAYVMLSMVLEQGFQDLTQVYIRITLGALLAMLLFRRHIRWQKFFALPAKDWVGIMLMGVFGYGLVVAALTIGVLNTTLINTSIIYATVPFFVYLFSFLLLKRKPQVTTLALLGVSFWGVGIISSNSLIPQLDGINRGDWWVLFGAACGALYVIGRKLMSARLNNRELSVVVMLVAACTTLALAMINGERFNWSSFAIPQVLIGLALGSLLNIVATFLENFGFNVLDEVFASQLLMFEAVFALVLGWVFYGETVSIIQLVGIALVSTSLMLMHRFSKN
jgi:drug/metabolite transporter (DMT)-like permease